MTRGVCAATATGARRPAAANAKGHDASAQLKWKVRHNVLDAVNELLEELDGIQQQISEQALEHVHSNEVILTFGYCRTVHLFLREAAKKRQFQVVVAEGGPAYEGQKLARDLASDGIQTTLITDSAVFAMMARANMVLLGAQAVLANGGVLAVVRCRASSACLRVHSQPLSRPVRLAHGGSGGCAPRGAGGCADWAVQAGAAVSPQRGRAQ